MLTLTSDGRARFRALTRAVARRAESAGKPQHFAIVLGKKVVSRPFVDPQKYLTVAEAQNLADRIDGGG